MNVKLMGLVIAGSLILGKTGARAADLVTYSFTGHAGSVGIFAGAPDAHPLNGFAWAVSATGMIGVDTDTTLTDDRYAFNGAAVGALDTGKYLELTITPDSGYVVNLSGIRFLTDRNESGFESLTVRTSVDSYVSNKASVTRSPADDIADQNHPTQSLSGLTNLSDVTLRLYAYGAEATSGISAIDDLVIEGTITVAVPEPAAIGLLGLTGVALFGRRRS